MSHAKINTIHINMHLATLSLTGRMACCHKIKRIYFYWTIMFSTHGLPHINISSAILNVMIQFPKCYWIIDGQHNMEENTPQIAKFMGPTWGPPGSCRPQMGPMLAPWTLLSGIFSASSVPADGLALLDARVSAGKQGWPNVGLAYIWSSLGVVKMAAWVMNLDKLHEMRVQFFMPWFPESSWLSVLHEI